MTAQSFARSRPSEPLLFEPVSSLGRVLAADRRFFERHSGRRLRLRLASCVEILQLRQAGQHGVISASKRLYVLVMIADADPGERVRLFGLGDPEWDTDLTEEACRSILANAEAQQGPWYSPQARAVYRVREDRDDR